MKAAALLLVAASLGGCSSRPPWADGALVTERQPAGEVREDLANFEARLLAAHNRERAAVGAAPLVWDRSLAAAASSYGPALAGLGKLAHSAPETRPGQGENLWMGTHDAYWLGDMVGSWIAEKKLFRPGLFPDVSRTHAWSDVGHYTQIIWPGTRRVGCALHRSAKWDYLICRYSPPGNVVGARVP